MIDPEVYRVLVYGVLVAWLTPIFYVCLAIIGSILHKKKQISCGKRTPELLIFQIPTIGNVKIVNKIMNTIKEHDLPTKVQTWVIIEEANKHKEEYDADKVVVVPKGFECEALYKGRALEYARQERLKLVEQGELSLNYVVAQSDDDATLSQGFMKECCTIDADIMIGFISPRLDKVGLMCKILDYERCVSAVVPDLFFTNINAPIYSHGEGLCISSRVDRAVNYKVSEVNPNLKKGIKLIASEDLFYTHKTSGMGFNSYCSREPIYVLPPMNIRDAIIQRNRWLWGHINAIKHGFLFKRNAIRVVLYELLGLITYPLAMIGIPLSLFGFFRFTPELQLLTTFTLFLWLGLRFYSITYIKGWKDGLYGMLFSYFTVTLSFFVRIYGLLKGDSKEFKVIQKEKLT